MVNLKYNSRAISGGKMQSLHIDTLKSQGKNTNANIFGYLSLCPILSVNTPTTKEVTHLQTQSQTNYHLQMTGTPLKMLQMRSLHLQQMTGTIMRMALSLHIHSHISSYLNKLSE